MAGKVKQQVEKVSGKIEEGIDKVTDKLGGKDSSEGEG